MEIRCNRDGREHWKDEKKGKSLCKITANSHPSCLIVISFVPARSMSKLGSFTPSLLNERMQSYNSTHFIWSTPLWFYSCQTPGLATSTWAPSPYPQVAPSCQQSLARCSTPRCGARQSSLRAMLSSGFQTSQVECRRWAQKRSAQIVTAECWTPLTLMSVPPKRKIIKEIGKSTKDDLHLCCLHFLQDGDGGIFLLQ